MKTGMVILALAILSMAIPAIATVDWSASWGQECSGCCIENHTVNFTIEIENTGSESFMLSSVRVELQDSSVIANWSGKDRTIDPGEHKSVVAKGRLPVFDDPDDAYYHACIYMRYNSTLLGPFANWSCSSDLLSMTLVNSSVHECDSDSNCSFNEYCSTDGCTSECVNITPTSSCGNFANHRWRDYECCSNSTCAQSQACVNYKCINVSCQCGVITDHRCVSYECCSDSACSAGKFCSEEHKCEAIECHTDGNCSTDKVCRDKRCEVLQCEGCAYAVNHTCAQYGCCDDSYCANDETCESHSCQRLNCEPLGYPNQHVCIMYGCISNDKCGANDSCQNHECKTLNCPNDSKVENHACVKLDCSPIEYTKEHGCVSYFSGEGINDNPLPAIILIALIVVIVLVVRKILKQKGAGIYGMFGMKSGGKTGPVTRNKKGRRVRKKDAGLGGEEEIVALAQQTVEETKTKEEKAVGQKTDEPKKDEGAPADTNQPT